MPTPQENSLFVEQASCLFFISIEFGSTEMLHPSQQGFYGRAGCPPHKKIHSLWNRHLACSLFRSNSVQLRCCTLLNKAFMGGQDAHPTRKFTLCGTGILPVLYFDRIRFN